jgi:hypothetical protein
MTCGRLRDVTVVNTNTYRIALKKFEDHCFTTHGCLLNLSQYAIIIAQFLKSKRDIKSQAQG